MSVTRAVQPRLPEEVLEKHAHKSKGAAEAHIRALVQLGRATPDNIRAYQCPYCNKWHVGHFATRKESATA